MELSIRQENILKTVGIGIKKKVAKEVMSLRSAAGLDNQIFADLTNTEHCVLYKEFIEGVSAREDFQSKRAYYDVKAPAIDKVFAATIMKCVEV